MSGERTGCNTHQIRLEFDARLRGFIARRVERDANSEESTACDHFHPPVAPHFGMRKLSEPEVVTSRTPGRARRRDNGPAFSGSRWMWVLLSQELQHDAVELLRLLDRREVPNIGHEDQLSTWN